MTDQANTNPRRRGRPAKEPSWLKAVAESVGRGMSLRRALWKHDVWGLTESEIRAIYRWVLFRKYMEEARIAYLREYGRIPLRTKVRPLDKLVAHLNAPDFVDRLLAESRK